MYINQYHDVLEQHPLFMNVKAYSASIFNGVRPTPRKEAEIQERRQEEQQRRLEKKLEKKGRRSASADRPWLVFHVFPHLPGEGC